MNISFLPCSRLYRFSPFYLVVIFCLDCSTTPKSVLEIGEEQLDSGITFEQGQRISIYTKDKRVVRMIGHRFSAKNIEMNAAQP